MDTRKALDGNAIGIMVVLCVIWGMQQVALKAAAHDITPLLQISLRSGIAALLVALLAMARKERISLVDATWRPGLVAGMLFALEYLLVSEALDHTSAGHTVVFLYTSPIFAALGLHCLLPAERLKPMQWTGIALAFGGIVMAFLGRGLFASSALDQASLWGDFLALGAGAAYGVTIIVIRCSSLSQAPASQTLLYQLLAAFVLLFAMAAASDQLSFNSTPMAWGSLAFQTLVVSFASFLVWFKLLRHYLASRLGVFSFMTPLFGVVLGAWLLHERIEPSFLAGALLVLAGIALVSGYEWISQAMNGPKAMRKEV
jgi:drug/metabolite transporter (DMT)-like permease